MAETVTISQGDTITQILKIKRGLKDHEVHAWLPGLRSLNPHISNLNQIYPGQHILIPDTLFEDVAFETTWQNAFSHIPRALESPHEGNTHLFLTATGTEIDSIAKGMFADGPYSNLPLSTKRAILLHNNPDLMHYLDTNRLPGNMLVDITPLRLDNFDKSFWQGERNQYMSYLRDFDPNTQDMFQQTGPENAHAMARLVQALQDAGAWIGGNSAPISQASASGYLVSGNKSLTNVNALAKQIYEDAAKQMGRKAAASVKHHNLKKLAQIIKTHPNYSKLMQNLQKLPQTLLPMHRHKLAPPVPGNVNSITFARHFSKQYFQAYRRWPSGKYMKTIARQLNGRVGLFKGMGRCLTWYVPAIIGVYSVFNAPAENRARMAFEEGFGILGGALGAWIGGELIGAAIASALCLGPFGAFVLVFVLASVAGLYFAHKFKKLGGGVYDFGSSFGENEIIHTPQQVLANF